VLQKRTARQMTARDERKEAASWRQQQPHHTCNGDARCVHSATAAHCKLWRQPGKRTVRKHSINAAAVTAVTISAAFCLLPSPPLASKQRLTFQS
jgi:hypothetical protein